MSGYGSSGRWYFPVNALWSRCSHVHHLVRQPVSLIAASVFPCRLGKILFPPVRIFVKNTMAL